MIEKRVIQVDRQRASDIAIELARSIEQTFGTEQRLPEVLAAFAIVFYSTSTPPEEVSQEEMEWFIKEASQSWAELIGLNRAPTSGLPC